MSAIRRATPLCSTGKPSYDYPIAWSGLRLLSETRNGRHSLYLYDEGSYDPLARVDGQGEHARLRYYHTDPNGLPQQLTEEDGRCIWQARYQVWGNTLAEQQESFFVEEQNLRFQGQYLDRETGLHYNTFRFYDPDIGRFISPDPIGLAGGINLFQYAPEPFGWVDPWGWAGNPANATHITYEGVKNGKPYIGYASKPGLGHSAEDVLRYRYPSTSHFDIAPQVVFVGDGQEGKNIARGLEQRIFEDRGGLAGTSNKQNPVGLGNKNRTTYLSAADSHRAASAAKSKSSSKGISRC